MNLAWFYKAFLFCTSVTLYCENNSNETLLNRNTSILTTLGTWVDKALDNWVWIWFYAVSSSVLGADGCQYRIQTSANNHQNKLLWFWLQGGNWYGGKVCCGSYVSSNFVANPQVSCVGYFLDTAQTSVLHRFHTVLISIGFSKGKVSLHAWNCWCWNSIFIWPVFSLFCVMMRKFQHWVGGFELNVGWSLGYVKFSCLVILLADSPDFCEWSGMWDEKEHEEEETFIFESACSQEHLQTLRTFWREIRKQTLSCADVFDTLFSVILSRVVLGWGENLTSQLKVWKKCGCWVTWGLGELNGPVWTSLLPFYSMSACSKEVDCAALPSGAAASSPKEASVSASCSSVCWV